MEIRCTALPEKEANKNYRDDGGDFDHRQDHLHAAAEFDSEIIYGGDESDGDDGQRLRPCKSEGAGRVRKNGIEMKDMQRHGDYRKEEAGELQQSGGDGGDGGGRADDGVRPAKHESPHG